MNQNQPELIWDSHPRQFKLQFTKLHIWIFVLVSVCIIGVTAAFYNHTQGELQLIKQNIEQNLAELDRIKENIQDNLTKLETPLWYCVSTIPSLILSKGGKFIAMSTAGFAIFMLSLLRCNAKLFRVLFD